MKLSDIPVRVSRSHPSRINAASVTAVLTELTNLLAKFVETGQPDVIDLRQLPRMQEATYQALKDALSTGEVSAVVNTGSKVEVLETQYPGVWWITHRGEHGAIVTELIEIAEIPTILKSHPTEIRNGLERLQRTLAEATTVRSLSAVPNRSVRHASVHDNTSDSG